MLGGSSTHQALAYYDEVVHHTHGVYVTAMRFSVGIKSFRKSGINNHDRFSAFGRNPAILSDRSLHI